MKFVYRGFGATGDVVIELRDGAKLEVRSNRLCDGGTCAVLGPGWGVFGEVNDCSHKFFACDEEEENGFSHLTLCHYFCAQTTSCT